MPVPLFPSGRHYGAGSENRPVGEGMRRARATPPSAWLARFNTVQCLSGPIKAEMRPTWSACWPTFLKGHVWSLTIRYALAVTKCSGRMWWAAKGLFCL
jgi:hypothetical protein